MVPTWGELGGRFWRMLRARVNPPRMCERCGDAMLRRTRGTKRCVCCGHITGHDLADIVAATPKYALMAAAVVSAVGGVGVMTFHVAQSLYDYERQTEATIDSRRSQTDSFNRSADSLTLVLDSLVAHIDSIETTLQVRKASNSVPFRK